jgi:uncharacterized membrane protein
MRMQLRRFIRERLGNFSTLTALVLPVLLLGAGLTLNTGALFLQKRHLQSVTDLAALTAAANLDKAEHAAALTLSDNGFADVVVLDGGAEAPSREANTLRVELGRYDADPTKSVPQRFLAGETPINAVRVTVRTPGEIYFPTPVLDDIAIAATGVATIAPEATFTIGSRLASLNDGVLNAVLGGLLGTTLNLSLSDYEALFKADVDAFAFLDALATELDLTTGTYRQILDGSASVAGLIRAAAKVPGLSLNARSALAKLNAALPKRDVLPLKKLLNLGKGENAPIGVPPSGPPTRLTLLGLINAAAAVSNGKNQVSVDSGLDLGPLSRVSLNIAVGEPPVGSSFITTGSLGTTYYTAQTRVRLVADVGTLRLLLLPIVTVRVPLLLDLGSARGELTSITCLGQDPSTVSVAIATTPALAEMYLAELPNPSQIRDFSRLPVRNDATLINVLGLRVTAGTGMGVTTAVSNASPTTLTFKASEITQGVVKTATVRDYSQSLTGGLLGSLRLNVEPVGLGLALGPLIGPLLSGAVAPLDTVLFNVLTALGVKLGSADIRVEGASCGTPVLVQ